MLRRDFIRGLTLGISAAAFGGVADAPAAMSAARSSVMLGIDVLAAGNFAPLRGLRVGLVTHRAGLDGQRRMTVDVLRRAPGVNLVKLFGPEHGIYGNAAADVAVQNNIDRRTGLPVFSLYGTTRRPTAAMLAGLDVMLIDLQDIGSRSYTYTSCMKLVIEACFDAGVRVIVLDRPNPLGGLKVDGPGLDRKWMSYVGSYQVPYVHGLTIGELACMATQTPGWLNLTERGRAQGRLEVIKMRGWRRAMRWRETGLHWEPTSPRIPTVEAAEGYPMTGLGCQLDEKDFSHGAMDFYPFRFVRFPGKRAEVVAAALRSRRIRGLGINPMRLRDGTEGVYLTVTDWAALRPTEVSFHMMRLSCAWRARNPFAELPQAKKDLFNKHTGCEAFFLDLCRRGAAVNVAAWLDKWSNEARAFQASSRRFWLYA